MVKQATTAEQPVEGAVEVTPQPEPTVTPEPEVKPGESPEATETEGKVNWEHRAKSAEGLVKSLQGKVTELESTKGFQEEVNVKLGRMSEVITEMASWQLDALASTDSERAESVAAAHLKREIALLGLSEDDPRLSSLKQIGTAKEALEAWNKYVAPGLKTAKALTAQAQAATPAAPAATPESDKAVGVTELLQMIKSNKALKDELKKALLSEDGAYDVLTTSPTGGTPPTDAMGIMQRNLAQAQRARRTGG